tara:strand:+ start:2087 stop:3076 length:990 start_codon:yes stop_codon:yes gene_type:complete
MSTSIQTSYNPVEIPGLAPLIERATEFMNRSKGGASALKADLHKYVIPSGSLQSHYQIKKPDGGSALREFTFEELAAGAEAESVPQAVDVEAVSNILFGRDGLIKKFGGGRADLLMEDIEVCYVRDLVADTTVGPIITSGRHRNLALQILLLSAGINAYRSIKCRCSVIEVGSLREAQQRIISANTGSRDFSRAEIRERIGSTGGVSLLNCDAIQSTILQANTAKAFKAAFSAYVKFLAAELQLNHFTPAQYSDAGNSLWNELEKVRPEGGTFSKWIKNDKETRFACVMSSVRTALPSAVLTALHNPANGPKAGKIAKALRPSVVGACF